MVEKREEIKKAYGFQANTIKCEEREKISKSLKKLPNLFF